MASSEFESGGRRPGRPGRRRVVLGLLAGAVVAGVALWYVLIPYPWTLATRNPELTSLMRQRVEEAAASGDPLEIRQEWVSLDAISPNLVRAVLVAEDYRFRQHAGIDWVSLAEEVHWTGDEEFTWRNADDRKALRAALSYVWANRNEIRGRSTLTQQLAKNLYWGTDRSFVRKVLEFVVAGRLERKLGKDRILELYLNVVEWGPGIFGAEAAARHYFGRPASSLTLEQAAALAGTLPHPLTSNPAHRPGRMEWRKNLILQRLDPSAGIPSAPMPLPAPELELPSPAGGIGEFPRDTVRDTVDTLRGPGSVVDTPGADTTGADTTVADTAGARDTVSAARDTTAIPLTGGAPGA